MIKEDHECNFTGDLSGPCEVCDKKPGDNVYWVDGAYVCEKCFDKYYAGKPRK